MMRTVISDTYSNHNLPIGAHVYPADTPDWSDTDHWWTQDNPESAVAIDPRDLAPACSQCDDSDAAEHGMCGSCLHNAYRSGWNPGD
jgi:hypothetical protein